LDDLLAALQELEPDLRDALELCNTRDREGGQPLADFVDELDALFPELAALCQHSWMMELVLRLCSMRRNA